MSGRARRPSSSPASPRRAAPRLRPRPGPGNSTALIAARFPDAEVIGLDTSPAMLESARARLPGLAFAQADAATWSPGPRPGPDLRQRRPAMAAGPREPCCRGCSASSARAACSPCRCPTTSPSPRTA
ncbi:methyltransferase domain-containing protein [Methylobacterium oryzae CBMB20]